MAIPVVDNGEIWTVVDARRCIEVSGCTDLMLGRGIVADPGLALAVLGDPGVTPEPGAPTWDTLQAVLWQFWTLVQTRIEPRARTGRMKQWLNYLRRRYPEADMAYQALRTVTDSRHMTQWMQTHLSVVHDVDRLAA